ncbi:MAG: alkaline phosphatase [Syntrophobacteraceae bacterium]
MFGLVNRRNVTAFFLTVAILCLTTTANASQLKYVFFFLGDGMSASQIQASEAYLTTLHGGNATLAADLMKPTNRLTMSKMPVAGIQTTYDAHALITDSASAGTAFACGIKTLSGVVGMDDTKTTSYKSVAELAHEKGKAVGVITSVSLDHATPAAYYASVPSRSYMNNIATQMVASGYEFFGGGGLVAPTAANTGGDTANNIWDMLTAEGYTVLNSRPSIMALKSKPKDKVVCINKWLQDSSAMPYAIDRQFELAKDPKDPNLTGNLSLAEMTQVAISNLYNLHATRGFFLMVEGGKVDWAGHANDAMATIGDMLDFDSAIARAVAFYKQHPAETLIIVTGDHETGGMTVGHATTGYTGTYGKLLGQKVSFTYFAQNQWATHKTANQATVCPDVALSNNLETDAAFRTLLVDLFGLDWATLNDYQKLKLEDAYDKSMCGANDNLGAENSLLYGSYEPIIVTITHILNEISSIGWTSYSHTGVPVPVLAVGEGASRFSGFYDNTDIAKRLGLAMGLGRLPVQR